MRTLTALCLVLCSAVEVLAQCHPPHYRTGATWVDDPAAVVTTISIPLHDFALNKLVCLATSLRERYRDRNSILVYIFSSHEASRRSIAAYEITEGDFETFSQIHAVYIFYAMTHEEYLKILPVGVRPPGTAHTEGPYSTRIDLPVATAPHCHQEIDKRCLVALKTIEYPDPVLKQHNSGKVVLTATVSPAGMMNHVRVVKTESVPPGAETILANAAAQNLSTWRLEPASHGEEIQITYSYQIDKSLRPVDGTQVHWALPNEIDIKANE